eukprot:CAMPEP_0178732942 /NCGR_PEP_ID=MMETSP0744-20121128/529_1 /TAXON_ID=913974 /ORGANISM="Nitzschia punctata, Strain CCMP561" /LENGTH=91 /DNA_ID=CAMNT_0020385089 /DNA_START=408 /DNA_END=683 /DNA_ORIENTATION=-
MSQVLFLKNSSAFLPSLCPLLATIFWVSPRHFAVSPNGMMGMSVTLAVRAYSANQEASMLMVERHLELTVLSVQGQSIMVKDSVKPLGSPD